MKTPKYLLLFSLSLIVVLLGGWYPGTQGVEAISDPEQPLWPAVSSLATSSTIELRRGLAGYSGVSDTYLRSDDPAPTAHGSEDTLHIKESASSRRTLLRFDLTTSGIPANATITDAYLELFVSYRYPNNPAQVKLYYLLKPWDETTATWNSTGLENWAMPGAGGAGTDYDPAALATVTLQTLYAYNRINIKSAVQRWLQDPANNHGLLITGSNIDLRTWASDDVREGERPRLIVTYEASAAWTPEPSVTPSPTRTATPMGYVTPTPASIIYSTGSAEALGANEADCIEAGPTSVNPDYTNVLMIWQGAPTMARLKFRYAGNNNRHHSVLVNDHVIGQLPGDSYASVCTGGNSAELSFDPSFVVSGENKISILADVPGETNSWSLQAPQIVLGGNVQGTKIYTVALQSSYDGTTQRAMIQEPIGYAPGAPTPLVIALHGWGGRDFDALRWMAEACNDRGWLLACSDTRNSNQHTASKAVQRDVMDLLNYMSTDPKYSVDSSRVYIVGVSMGGMMASTIVAKYPDRFAALAELKGPTRLDDWYWEVETWRKNVISAEVGGTPSNNPFAYQARSAGAMPMNLRNVPTIIVHGLNDTTVPYHHAEDLKAGMEGYNAEYVALYPYEGDHGDDHPAWDTPQILSFFSQYTLNTCPLTVTVRTDEPKSYYWLNIAHSAADHWTQVNASYNLGSKTVIVEVRDERATPVAVNVTLDLARMGLPTGVAYTLEDTNLTTGEFAQSTVQAGPGTLTLNVPRDHHRYVLYPFAAPAPQTRTLRQGEQGYAGVADTYIEAFATGTNHALDGLRISNGNGRAPLLRFDLSGLPPGAVIKAAQLGLYTTSKYRPEDSVEATIYRLLQEWNVNQVTWNERMTGQSWTTAGALAPGEDYDPTAEGSLRLNSTGVWYRYNVTDLVNEWLADPAHNYGIVVRGGAGNGTFTFNSSESPSYKPELVIVYTQATPTPTPTSTPTGTIIPTATRTSTPVITPFPTGQERIYLPSLWK